MLSGSTGFDLRNGFCVDDAVPRLLLSSRGSDGVWGPILAHNKHSGNQQYSILGIPSGVIQRGQVTRICAKIAQQCGTLVILPNDSPLASEEVAAQLAQLAAAGCTLQPEFGSKEQVEEALKHHAMASPSVLFEVQACDGRAPSSPPSDVTGLLVVKQPKGNVSVVDPTRPGTSELGWAGVSKPRVLARRGAVISGYKPAGIPVSLNLHHFVLMKADGQLRRVVRDATCIIEYCGVGPHGSGYRWQRQGGVPGGLRSIICIDLLWLVIPERVLCTLLHPRTDKSKFAVGVGGRFKSSRQHSMDGGE